MPGPEAGNPIAGPRKTVMGGGAVVGANCPDQVLFVIWPDGLLRSSPGV